MGSPNAEQIRAVLGTLPVEALTTSGAARMKDLNKALAAAGFDAITAEARDAATSLGDLEEPPIGDITVVIEDAPANPIPLYVHGVGRFSIRLGVEIALPVEALAALENANITYTEVKG